ncbi:hypothetical protein BamMEX5DRAFT_6816 [Burkholderia ambifaria MEX-5]|uniref:Uncharacterized protein n=1 Tax=Burkholderia ambifaria MEX-5 TaxID=396597 RepID=B1TGA0_9BURK|nr:hypothetical protein BamMEX5DRAFT_6816 [Burkholderia ambifaria MEX-5]
MSAIERAAADVARDAPPLVERIEAAADDPVLAPQHAQRARDLVAALEIRAVVFEVDRRRRAVVLAHRVHGARLRERGAIRGERLRRERREPGGTVAHHALDIRIGAAFDQRFGQRRRLDQEEPVEIRGRERTVGLLVHRERRRDVEQHHPFDGRRMIEREPVRDARAAIVRAHVELLEAEMPHHGDLVGRHRAFRIRRMPRVARRPARRAVAAQVGRDHREVIRQRRGDAMPDHVGLRMAVQQQKRRPRASLDTEDVGVLHRHAKRCKSVKRHGLFLVGLLWRVL